MDLNELERIAMRGGPMPDGLSLANQTYFEGIRYLYAQFHSGAINRECGSADKKKMLRKRELREQKESYERELAFWHANLRRDIEAAHTAYKKNRTLENADRLSAVLDGRL